MKYYFLFFLLTNFCSVENSFSAIANNQNFNQAFTGQLNHKVDLTFSLKYTNGRITGFYYYDKIGTEIKLIGELINGNAVIYELDYQNKKVAKITGKLSQNSFVGKWQSLSNKKSYILQLKPTSYIIPVLPKNMVGIYNSDYTQCKLSIDITKIKNEYLYNFNSKSRKFEGKVTFSRSLEEHLVYINFIGIKWAEDHGDVTNEANTNRPNGDLPTVVQGLLDDGEIIIQNYGNAMNHYLKIGECDFKYIDLKKSIKKITNN